MSDDDDQEEQAEGEEDEEDQEEARTPRPRRSSRSPARRDRRDDIQGTIRQSDNRGPDTTATLLPLTEATAQDWLGSNQDPDVLLSIPNVGIDRIALNVKNVRAHVELHAKVLDLLELHVGADAYIEEVDLEIDNVRIQAMLKVKLEQVREIVGDVVNLLDEHPEILTSLTGGLGRGLEGALARKTPEQMDAEGNQPKLDTPQEPRKRPAKRSAT